MLSITDYVRLILTLLCVCLRSYKVCEVSQIDGIDSTNLGNID